MLPALEPSFSFLSHEISFEFPLTEEHAEKEFSALFPLQLLCNLISCPAKRLTEASDVEGLQSKIFCSSDMPLSLDVTLEELSRSCVDFIGTCSFGKFVIGLVKDLWTFFKSLCFSLCVSVKDGDLEVFKEV